jgi:hypothetical protein
MDGINWGILQNSINQPNPGERFQMGLEQGKVQRRQRELDAALRGLATNPDDENAIGALIQANPQMGMQYRQQQQTQRQTQQEQQRRQAMETAGILRPIYENLKTMPYEQRRAALQQLAPRLSQFGIPAEMIASYDPTDGNLDSDILVANSLNQPREQSPGALQKDYEFMASRNQQLADQYLQNRANPVVPVDVAQPDGSVVRQWVRAPQGSAGGGSSPAPGTVEDGFRFKGGNPADPNSWEPVAGGAGQQGPQTFR